MLKLHKIYLPNMSLRLNMTIVLETVLLLLISLSVLLYFTRQILIDEVHHDVEQTLDGMVLSIDNVLTSVEQTTNNISQEVQTHLNHPELMNEYSRQIVETNPNVVGCAIVFRPGYFSGHDLFMAYMHRKGGGLKNDEDSETERRTNFTDRPYTEQKWYTEPMEKALACWVGPLKNEEAEDEPLITYCQPIIDQGECVGVIATDLSINLLTKLILASHPTPHSYCVLLNKEGSFIIHPDAKKLNNQTIFYQMEHGADPSVRQAAKALMSGETGYESFKMNGQNWVVFYRPFDHNDAFGAREDTIGWSTGVVYLESDILGYYRELTIMVIVITIVGIFVFFSLCRLLIRRQMKPLRMLTSSAQRIAEGDYNISIPRSDMENEIGRLQNHFRKMQQALSSKSAELEQLMSRLQERNAELSRSFSKAQGSDRMKTIFLNYMTKQMNTPANLIEQSVTKLVNNYATITPQEAEYEVSVIKEQTDVMVSLVDNIIDALQIEAKEFERKYQQGKEVAYEE